MHAYFGACASGLKLHRFPTPRPCGRQLGAGCLALWLPRRCGPADPRTAVRGYRWARTQQRLYPRYRAAVVPSDHLRREFLSHGIPPDRLHVAPLFPADRSDPLPRVEPTGPPNRVLFLGRMTVEKGGDRLILAAALAGTRLGRPLRLTLAGDGPQRPVWQELARRLGVDAAFPGWLSPAVRAAALSETDLLAVPSVWPEPFGLVGPDAGWHRVPAVAFDVGGVREWLADGVTGWLAPGDPPTPAGMADTLTLALSDPARLRAAGKAARQRAEALSLSAHLDRLEPVLAAAAGG